MKKTVFAGAIVLLMLALHTAGALASDYPPVTGEAAGTAISEAGARTRSGGFGKPYAGLTVSDRRLRQGSIGGLTFGLSLCDPQGDAILFRERLEGAQDGGICLTLLGGAWTQEPVLQLDGGAVSILQRCGITEVCLLDAQYRRRVCYRTADIASLRARGALAEDEALCLRGLDNPVTVLGTDGMRRIYR